MTPLETSVDAAALHNDALVADISFTWMEVGDEKKKLASLPRFKSQRRQLCLPYVSLRLSVAGRHGSKDCEGAQLLPIASG